MADKTWPERLWWPLLAIVCLMLLLPLTVVEIPPLLDYPNHLARLYVLAFGQSDPVLSAMFRPHWSVIPNIAIDILVPPFLKFMSVYTAGKLILAATLLIPVAGIIAYARASFGRVSWWQLGAGFVVYHALILMGFLNFSLSIGIALLLAAGWIAFRETHLRQTIILALFSSVALFFFHIFSLFFYLVLIGSSELSRLIDTYRADRRKLPGAFLNRAAVLVTVALPPIILSALAPVTNVKTMTRWGVWPRKFQYLDLPFLNYDWRLDCTTGLLLLATAAYLIRKKQMMVARPALIALIILCVIYLISPRVLADTWFIQDRWPVMMGLLLFAGASTHDVPRKSGIIIASLLAILFAAKIGMLTSVWYNSREDVAEMRRMIAPVPAGARVLVVLTDEVDNPDYWKHMRQSRSITDYERTYVHLPALLTIERHAFWPDIFASPFKQPLEVLPPYNEDLDRVSYPLTLNQLNHVPTVLDLSEHPFLPHWREQFDYLMLLLPGSRSDVKILMPEKLTYIGDTDLAALYKIKPDAK